MNRESNQNTPTWWEIGQFSWTATSGGQKEGASSLFTVADPGFSSGGAPTPKSAIIFQIFAENCMKMNEFGPPGRRMRGRGHAWQVHA